MCDYVAKIRHSELHPGIGRRHQPEAVVGQAVKSQTQRLFDGCRTSIGTTPKETQKLQVPVPVESQYCAGVNTSEVRAAFRENTIVSWEKQTWK